MVGEHSEVVDRSRSRQGRGEDQSKVRASYGPFSKHVQVSLREVFSCFRLCLGSVGEPEL